MRILILLMAVIAAPAWASDPLDGITIRPDCASPAYDRKMYRHWIDADKDGQNTRAEVLIEESLGPVTFKTDKRRLVVSGEWSGPFSGMTFTSAGDMDIDHMVPLKEAHLSGGCHWSKERRQVYANDLDHPNALVAVYKRWNRQKGAKDPANWMPPNAAYRCQYLRDWIDVKRREGLSMDQAEADFIRREMAGC